LAAGIAGKWLTLRFVKVSYVQYVYKTWVLLFSFKITLNLFTLERIALCSTS